MFNKTILFLTGFGLMVVGFTYIIMYFNLFTMGYSLLNYLIFITTRIECLITVIGLILVIISTYKGGKTS